MLQSSENLRHFSKTRAKIRLLPCAYKMLNCQQNNDRRSRAPRCNFAEGKNLYENKSRFMSKSVDARVAKQVKSKQKQNSGNLKSAN